MHFEGIGFYDTSDDEVNRFRIATLHKYWVPWSF